MERQRWMTTGKEPVGDVALATVTSKMSHPMGGATMEGDDNID